jgi:SAM-dependent methyltransferase
VARPEADRRRTGTFAFRQHGVGVELVALEGVFAGAGVDAGTRHLLRWLAADRYTTASTVLDLGCGYGPLGLWLAAAAPHRRVLAADRDARALEAARLGAAANGLTARVGTVASLGYDGTPGPFDLVVSNVPAKIGSAGLAHVVLDAVHHLHPGGSVAVVVVARLAAEVEALLGDPAVEVLDTRPARAYTAFEYRFTGVPARSSAAPGFERGVYRRGRDRFAAAGVAWEAEVSWSLPEFDTLGRSTVAALEAVGAVAPSPEGPAVIAGTGQGHLALGLRALATAAGEARRPLRLVDPDLLAIRTTLGNVGGDGVETRHQGWLDAPALSGAALAVVALPEREPVATTAAVLGAALPALGSAPAVLHGRAADVARVVELLGRHGAPVAVRGRHQVGGHVAVVVRAADTATPPG